MQPSIVSSDEKPVVAVSEETDDTSAETMTAGLPLKAPLDYRLRRQILK